VAGVAKVSQRCGVNGAKGGTAGYRREPLIKKKGD